MGKERERKGEGTGEREVEGGRGESVKHRACKVRPWAALAQLVRGT